MAETRIRLCGLLIAILFLIRGEVLGQECARAEDCRAGECCVIGSDRYAVAECRPLGKKGQFCIPGASPVDRVFRYPNGRMGEYFRVYKMFCPCARGYRCKNNNRCARA